jgi:hypothetical protein
MIVLKEYKLEKVEIGSKIFIEPIEPCYFFETGIRRSIRIAPIFTTWKKEEGKDEEIMRYEVTCVYSSFECKIEKFIIERKDIEGLYYSNSNVTMSIVNFVKSWINNEFLKRTKERFEEDLMKTFEQIKK